MSEDQWRLIDRLAETALGPSAPQAERRNADNQLQELQKPEHLGVLRYVLDRSQSPYTHFFAAKALLEVVTDNWNKLVEAQQPQELRGWLVSFIGNKGQGLQKFVLVALVRVLTRLTKLGWLDHPALQVLPKETHDYFITASGSVDQAAIGLLILNSLVAEINQQCPRMPLSQHRKTVVSFRDSSLLDIFQVSLRALERIRREHPACDPRLTEVGINLAVSCLTYDFVGIFSDESTDDAGTVQIPNTWKTVLLDPATLQLFFGVYSIMPPEHAHNMLKCVVQLASVRRTFFSDDQERSGWLNGILCGVLVILRGKIGLDSQQNYHEFCRLLSRIKPNYQLSELVAADYYAEWLRLTAEFSVDSFVHWQRSPNSSFYVLSLWQRLLSAQPYLKGDKPSRLMDYAPDVVHAYIKSRLELARAAVEGHVDNALEDQEMLLVQLENLPVLARAMYERVGPFLISLAQPLLQKMRTMVGMILSAGHFPPGQERQTIQEFSVLDAQMAWLVYMTGSITGHNSTMGASEPQAESQDGEVTAMVLEIASVITQRLAIPQQTQQVTLQRLQSAVLYFLNGFRKAYIGETSIPSSRIYPRLRELVGLEDNIGVLRVIFEHIVSNLRAWCDCPRIIAETLTLFYDLSRGYSSGRLVLQLQEVKAILHQHANLEVFPFVGVEANTKERTKFYKTLTNLLLLETSGEIPFEIFMRPLQERGFQMLAMPDAQLGSPEVRVGIIGWLRDIRGVCASCLNKRTYSLFFDWVFPFVSNFTSGSNAPPLMLRICQLYTADPGVSVPLLRFYADFVNNKSQRIEFEASSPNGILLFREASAMLKAFGEPLQARLAQLQSGGSQIPEGAKWSHVYKGLFLCIDILARALFGGYCNFGVFALYQDPALDTALSTIVNLILQAPLEDVLSFQKLGASYFYLMEILFSAHTGSLLQLPTPHFMQLLQSLEKGVMSVELSRHSVVHATSALGHLCTFYYNQMQKTQSASGQQPGCRAAQNVTQLQQHFSSDPQVFSRVLAYVFHIILSDELANQWSMSRPMLPLILIDENSFVSFKHSLVSQVQGERQQRLLEAFEKLMEGVDKSLEPKNRDKFTQNITVFRHQVKSIL
eukprot:Hpha_TRINITY_DN8483_c0_g1::TRINITY_DN8483_c0_g1_i1::g.34687::m.34687/K18460/XPO7, EXP7; exportin-7